MELYELKEQQIAILCVVFQRRWGGFITPWLVVLVPLLLLVMWGCVRETDLTLEARQHMLESALMCPVCDGQTLDQSQAQIATDMRSIVRTKLQDGEGNQQILDFFVARYGSSVLASPEPRGFGLLAWVMPAVIVLFGLAVLGFVVRNMHRHRKVGRSGTTG